MAKEYEITLPIVGKAYITVIADSEDEALEMAMSDVCLQDVEEWEAVYAVVRGNVLYAPLNEPVVDIVGEAE